MVLMTLSKGFKVLVGEVTAKFGNIDSVHKTPHTGTDYYLPIGSEIHAPFAGVVSRVADYGLNKSLGKAVFVKFGNKQYVVGHLSETKVHVGQIIHKGDLLALSGNTGNSTGPHMHFGAFDSLGHFIDPCLLNHGHPIPFSSFQDDLVSAFTNIINLI